MPLPDTLLSHFLNGKAETFEVLQRKFPSVDRQLLERECTVREVAGTKKYAHPFVHLLKTPQEEEYNLVFANVPAGEKNGVGAGDLASRLGKTKQATTAILQALSKRGAVVF